MATQAPEPIMEAMRALARRIGPIASSDSPPSILGEERESPRSRLAKNRAAPWDGFVSGPENQLALAAIQALAGGKDWSASPLVLHGPSGSGKTRLLEGFVAEWMTRRPDSSLAMLRADEFVTACLEAGAPSAPGDWFELRDRFRSVDLFVLDDLKGIDRSPAAIEELIFTLDALEENGAVVAVASRTGPAQWTNWPKRLVNRFHAGLAVRVDPPLPDSRRRYLLEHSPRHHVRLTAEAVDLLTDAADGYRALEGWLHRLALIAKIEGKPLDGEQAQSLLSEPGENDPNRFDRLVAAVAAKFGVTVRALKSSDRRRILVEPRQIAMFLASRLTTLSIGEIGRQFGGRDPATVRHSCAVAQQRFANDAALAAVVETIKIGFGDIKR